MTPPEHSSDEGPGHLIPLTNAVDVISPERQEPMREAVIQVIIDLVIRRVPPQERSPLFEDAGVLLDQAGRSLPELLDAAGAGPEQEALFRELGLV